MLINTLSALGDRILRRDKDLTAAAGIVGDLSHALTRDDADELRRLIAAVAVVRERLESDPRAFDQPLQVLKDQDSHAFLAGAMWALTEAYQAKLDEMAERAAAASSGGERGAVRAIVLELLHSQPTITPSAVASEARGRGLTARPDTVSKALSDLVQSGHVAALAPDPAADRRVRSYGLAQAAERQAEPRPLSRAARTTPAAATTASPVSQRSARSRHSASGAAAALFPAREPGRAKKLR